MLGRLAAVAAMAALMVGCAGLEPAGRNASREPQASPPAASAPVPEPTYLPPPAVTAAPLPPPAASAPAPAPVASAPPPVAAPAPAPTAAASAPTTAPVTTVSNDPPPSTRRSGEIVVPAERERQVPVPNGDPRSASERMQDINAWDRCVTHVQSAYERDPMRPQLQSPEEYCSQSLGMADRDAIPLSRSERRR